MPSFDILTSNVLFDVIKKLDKDEVDEVIDAFESVLNKRQQKKPTVKVALAIGSLVGLRLALNCPDDDDDQTHPV